MENLNFIDPLLHGIKPIEDSTSKLSVKQLACAGFGSLLIGAVLKKAGHAKTAAVVGGLALPLLSAAVYKKLAK
ncbi:MULTISPECIES: PrgI family protein [Flavobacterium]|uniref:PrgI family protein n=1 Tax=Flavobacterium endoglycinae TaxID=2816357 RepID=A0ABX7QDC6_9FLAO|nr:MULTISPECIES: PrgI family protein [Flavobacterium]QSW88664.1 PrgI family protein [Flavobacterium endoglycinae]